MEVWRHDEKHTSEITISLEDLEGVLAPPNQKIPQIPFHSGSPMIIAGPTGSGKTYWTHKLLRNEMFTQPVSTILYCYGVFQDYFNKFNIPNLTFHEGLPTKEQVEDIHDGNFHIIVLNDLMEYIIKSIDTQNLFTIYCHHFNITAIFVTQNIFAPGPYARTININTHILVIFANKRDESQALYLGKQLFSWNSKIFVEAYEDATSEMFGYLIVDCDTKSSRDIRLRTNIFPGEQTICYIKK